MYIYVYSVGKYMHFVYVYANG